MNIFLETFNLVPSYILAIFIFIFGSIIGSFLNVVILRKDTQENLNGRSHCTKCEYNLRWYDLIPILSYISLRGNCRKCDKRINVQYPLVEISTGLIFTFLFFLSPQMFLWNALIFSILICIFVYDLKTKIIPNEWSYTFAILTLASSVYVWWSNGFGTSALDILNLTSGLIIFTPFFLLWYISKGTWIGLGDGKLALGIGWYLGFVSGINAIILGFWIGALAAIFLKLFEKYLSFGKITMKTEIPFGPFLILGILIEVFFRLDVLGISMFLM